MVDSIESGLQQIFNYQPPNAVVPGKPETAAPLSQAKEILIKQANDLYTKALDAQRDLDWTKYGDYIKQLGTLLKELNK